MFANSGHCSWIFFGSCQMIKKKIKKLQYKSDELFSIICHVGQLNMTYSTFYLSWSVQNNSEVPAFPPENSQSVNEAIISVSVAFCTS